jgi:hypothetical protein
MPQLDSGYTVRKPDGTLKGTALGWANVYRNNPSTAPVSCVQWASASIAPPAGLPPFSFHLTPRDGNSGKATLFHVVIWNYTGPGTYDLGNPRSLFSWANGESGQAERALMVRGNRSMLGAGSGKIKVNPDGSGTLTVEGFFTEPMVIKGPGTRPGTRPGSAELIWACNDPRDGP